MTNTTKKKNLVWRLAKAPTREDVVVMLEKSIITKEEAKQLLFNLEDTNDKIKALEKQVEFLEGVVERLTERREPQTIIKYIESYPWPRYIYANGWSTASYGTGTLVNNAVNAVQSFSGGSGNLKLANGNGLTTVSGIAANTNIVN